MTDGPRSGPYACSLARLRLGDLDVVTAGNGELQLAFFPQVGGRLISLCLHGDEVLWRNPAYVADDLSPVVPRATWPRLDGTMASWANIGGNKTWPAPQGWSGADEWSGPPDEILDAGSYAVEAAVDARGAAHVTLTSASDPRTGLRISRAFTLPASGTTFSQVSTFVNDSQVPVRWSVWEVTQVDTTPRHDVTDAGAFRVEVTLSAAPLCLLDVVGTAHSRSVPGYVEVPVQETVGKLGFPNATGRVTWLRGDGVRLEQTTIREPEAVYPDSGCAVELWLQYPVPEPLAALGGLHPDAHLVEMEVLSPLVEIPPGRRTSLAVQWWLDRRSLSSEAAVRSIVAFVHRSGGRPALVRGSSQT